MSKIEQFSYDGIGYQKLMNYQSWRIAVLNYIEGLEPENIMTMDAHQLTDEAFVLLEGQAVLYELIDGQIIGTKMEKNIVYNIKKGHFHTHVLSKDCKLLIIEEESTNDSNTIVVNLTEQQRKTVKELWLKWYIN